MVGAAGVAATAGATAAFADDAKPPPKFSKFLPYAQVGSREGDSRSTGNVTLFMPAMQALNKLLYLKMGGELQTSNGRFEQIGAGYRQKILPTWIVGGFAFYDEEKTKHGNTFSQIELGAELLNPNWEFHATGYSVTHNGTGLTGGGAPQLLIDGNTIALERNTEIPYSGFEGHGSYKIFRTPFTDLRLYAGGFRFTPDSEFDHRAIAGPKGGLEYNIYDIDFLGPQSRLQIQGEVRHDPVRQTSGFIGVTLRIPLDIGDDSGQGAQVLDELDRRMVDDPNPGGSGNILIHGSVGKPEPVIIYGTDGGRTEPTNSIFYVDNSKGAGTYKDPTDFVDATTRGGSNALFILTDFEGNVHEPGNLNPGDIVAGGGTTLTVKGAESGTKITHTFAPGVHDPVVNVPSGQTAITLADHVALYNFSIEGPFGTAIYGHNPGTVTAHGIHIIGEGGESGQTGIFIRQDNSTPLDFLGEDIDASDVADGIYFDTNLSAGGVSEAIALNTPTISNVGEGIAFRTEVSGSASVNQHVDIENANIDAAYRYGIDIESYAGGLGAITQTGAINNASISGASVGIGIYGGSTGGTLTQNISIDPTHIASGGEGLLVSGYAYDGGSVIQTLHADGLDISNMSGNAIAIYGSAGTGGALTQTGTLSNVTLDAISGDGIHIDAGIRYGTLGQTIAFDGLTATSLARGAFIGAESFGLGGEGGGEYGPGGEGSFALSQHVTFNDADIHATGDAIRVSGGAQGYTSAAQYVAFTGDSHLESDAGDIYIYAAATNYAHLDQSVSLAGVTLDDAGGNGISIAANANANALTEQYVSIAGATIAYAGLNGIDVGATAGTGGTIGQTAKLNDVHVAYSYDIGINVHASATGSGTTLTQHVSIDPSDASGHEDGLVVSADGNAGAVLHQYASISDFDTSYDKYDGVQILAHGQNAAAVTQFVTLDNVTVEGGENSFGSGIYVGGNANTGSSVSQTINATNLNVSGVYGDGVYVSGRADSGGTLSQYVTINGGTISSFGNSGIYTYLLSQYAGFARQNVSLTGVDVSGNRNGVEAYAGSRDAYAFQHLTLDQVTADNESNDGVSLIAATYNGTTLQRADIDGLQASYEGDTGLYIDNRARGNVAAQYIYVADSTFTYDRVGVAAYMLANQGYTTTLQKISIDGSTIAYNGTGVAASNEASNGASTQQILLLQDDDISHNYGDGLNIYTFASDSSFAAEYLYLHGSNSNVSDNGGTGIAVSSYAYGGGNIEENIGIYDAHIERNENGGVSIDVHSYGYRYASGDLPYYYSHITLLTGISYDTIAGNTGNGVSINITSDGYGGSVDGYVYIYGDSIQNNTGNGFFQGTTVGELSNVAEHLHIYDSAFNDNGADGLHIATNVAAQGVISYSYIYVTGSDLSGNAGSGFVEHDYAQGYYSQNFQTTSIDSSTFRYNGAAGATFYSGQSYGPGGFGATSQSVTITGSDFSHNIADGLDLELRATNNQGRAEQHFTISESTFTQNGRDGLHSYRYAGQGVYIAGYPCTTVQGLYGGCSFDRQTIYVDHSDFSHNMNDGIYIGTTLNHYGAAYTLSGRAISDTLSLDTVTANYNGRDGLEIEGRIGDNSYLYENIVATNSHFDHNGAYGIYAYNHATGNSTVVQYVTITGGSADDNTRDGINIHHAVDSGSYAYSSVGISGTETNNNGNNGVTLNLGTDEGYIIQNVSIDTLTSSGNGNYGLLAKVNSYGAGAYIGQMISIANSTFANNFGGGEGSYGTGAGFLEFASGGGTANQDVTIDGSHATGGITGFHFYGYAGSGSYATQIAALTNTTATGNSGTGASFNVVHGGSAYTYGGTTQTITVDGGDFSHNGGDGLYFGSRADGQSARAGQYVTITNTTATYNGRDGVRIQRFAEQGGLTYSYGGESGYPLTCDYAQGNYGGCATVRQTINISGSDLSHNAGNGILLITSADTYGSIYNQSGFPSEGPTFNIAGSTVNDNGGNGLFISNDVANNSFAYQYVIATDTAFDRNATNGIYVTSYAHGNAQIVENLRLYAYAAAPEIDANGGDGIRFNDHAVGQSSVYSDAYVGFLYVDGNTGAGISLSATGDQYSNSRQTLEAGYNSFSTNGQGVALHASGYGADQQSHLTDNTVRNNTNEGVQGIADNDAYQYIGVYGANTVTGNAPDYDFHSYTGATQIVN